MLSLSIPAAFLVALALPQDPPQPAKTGPVVGKPAPAARVNDHEGRGTAIAKKNSSGAWTVLAFYPKAATPG